MKIKRILAMVLTLGVVVGSVAFTSLNPVVAQEKADEELTIFKDGKKYDLPEDNMFILEEAMEDVNGNGEKEKIYLLGKRYEDSPIYMEHTYILVEDAKGKGYVVRLPEDRDGGYLPSMTLADVNGDGAKEIMVALPTGGSGGIVGYFVYTLKDNKPELIFDSDEISVDIKGNFEDDYKAKISIKDPKGIYDMTTIIDVKDKKEMYDELELYKDGKLLYPQDVMLNPYSLIEFRDLDNDGVAELETYQAIKGTCNADGVAAVITNWKLIDGNWQVIRLGVEKYNY